MSITRNMQVLGKRNEHVTEDKNRDQKSPPIGKLYTEI